MLMLKISFPVMFVTGSPHDTPTMAAINTDTVVWPYRYADIRGFIFALAPSLRVTMVAAVSTITPITPIRLYHEPSLASVVILLLHKLQLRRTTTCWSWRLHCWGWWKQRGVFGDPQRQCRDSGGERQRLD